MPITTKVVSSNLDHGEVYSVQPYVVKFVSGLGQAGGFLRVSDGSTGSATFDCHCKSMESWVGTKNLVGYNVTRIIQSLYYALLPRVAIADRGRWIIWVSYNAPILFSKSTIEVFSLQGTCYSPNTLPTMVHGQSFYYNPTTTPIEKTILPATKGHTE